jgi:serine-type D-Ala-D-Ala carboxypeptidase/endopeptidase (penicillin-binding protein 4)
LPANVKADPTQVEIARLESPPLSLIAAKTMKPSQNMYTETLLWTLGEQLGRSSDPTSDSSQLGINAVKSFMKQIGIPDDGFVQYDGSGLSRHDLITPAAVVSLYSYMGNQSRFSQAWRNSLTIGGVDGTLASRFKGTAAQGNIRGKTGTIDQVSALSGYMTTAAGEPVVLSIVVNGVPTTRTRTALIDDIVVALANFNGRIDP